ncbi:MAG: FtsX-like permease family protein [Cyanobacteria bacterium SZAS LIN-3]|nr:FtsX-like permease family protein [Cyanobacteria bacterium SZAS LIN-3]MBS2005608.1 FtsX-like permease family protein [Cyanobacteria bacterium SZAS TMP-1]
MFDWLIRLLSRTPLGWLQLKHDRARLLVSIGGILFADSLMFMQLGIMAGLYDTNTMLHRNVNADIVLLSSQAQTLINLSTFPRRRIFQARDCEEVKSAESCYLTFSVWRNPDTNEKTNMLIVGVDPDARSFDMPEVNAQLNKIKLPEHFLFDRGTRGNYKRTIDLVGRNQQVCSEIEGRRVRLAGLFDLGASFATDGALFTSDQNFLRLFPKRTAGQLSLGLIRLKPGYDAAEVVARLNKQLPHDVRAYTKKGFTDFEINYLDSSSPISVVFGMGTIIGFIIGIVMVYQVLSTDVNDHMAEYATFKAIGYSNWYLYGILIEEIAILSTVGFLPSVVVAMCLYRVLQVVGSLPIYMPMDRLIFVYSLTLIMCGLSAFIASRKLRTADPAEIF